MLLSCPIKRHHRSWRGGDGTYEAGKTNRHGHNGQLAKKVNLEIWGICNTHVRELLTYLVFSVRFDKNGSGKIAWENGEEKLGQELQSSTNSFVGHLEKHILVCRWIPFGGCLNGCDWHGCHWRFGLLHRLPCIWSGLDPKRIYAGHVEDLLHNILLQDKDGLLTTAEAEVVVRLFLPMSAQQTDCFVSQLVAKMADGGKTISSDHFEKSVREAGKSLPAEH